MNKARTFIRFGLRLAFGTGVLLAMFFLVDVSAVLSALGKLDPLLFLVALTVNVLGSIFAPALATRSALASGRLQIPLFDIVRINLAMRFYVLTLPHAITVGMRWARYRDSGKGVGVHAATLILFEKIVQFNVIIAFACVFLLLSRDNLPFEHWPLVSICVTLLLIGIFALSLFLSKMLYNICVPSMHTFTRWLPRMISHRLIGFLDSVETFQSLGRTRVLEIVVWNVVGYLLFVLSAYIIILGLSLPLDFTEIGWMRSVVFLLTVLPITVGGLGVREAGFAMLLYRYGIDGPTAVAFPVILLGIQLLIGAMGALTELQRVLIHKSTVGHENDSR